jgi:hypothetical protein
MKIFSKLQPYIGGAFAMFSALGYRPRILDMTPEESLKQDEMRLISDARRARRQQREDYRASVIREVEELKREGRRNRLR